MLKTIEIKEVLDKKAFAEIIDDRVEFLIEDCILNGKKIGKYDKKRINKKLANLKTKEVMYILGQCDALLLSIKTLDVKINSNYYNFMRHMQDTYAS